MSKLWFDIGEHVVCRMMEERAGVAVALDALPTIIIYDPDGVAIELEVGETEVDMTQHEVGNYHYDFDTVGRVGGNYRARVKAIYSGRTTIVIGEFKLH